MRDYQHIIYNTNSTRGPTPGKSSSYSTSGQGSISSAPTPKELEMAAEMERLKNLYEATNIKLQEQNNKYEAQQEELAAVKRMVAMIMAEKQSSMENNQEGELNLIYLVLLSNLLDLVYF
jgi:hypothetical protein